MAIAFSAGPRENCARVEPGSREQGPGWANVRPLEREPTGAVGEWSDLLASISHELRTPLNAVIGFSDAMQQEVFGPIGNARYQEYVRHIRSSGAEILQAAEDALAMTAVLAQPKAVALEDVRLAPMVENAADDLSARCAARGCSIMITIPEGLQIRGDHRILPGAIRQLVAIGVSRAAPGATIEVSATAEHGLVELAVRVSGMVADAPAICEQAEITRAGLGLGRRELGIWLATALLDLLDCRLAVDGRHGSLALKTTLEESIQGSFFAGGAHVTA